MSIAPQPAGPPAPGPIERAAEASISLGHRIAQVSIACMMALITADVIARNVFHRSLLISDEVSGYLLVAMTFFGIAYSLRSGSLLRIEFLLFALPKRLRGLADVSYDLIALVVCLVLLRSMIRFTTSAAVMLSGWPALCPSPWPGAPSRSGARNETPGFWEA